MKKVSVIIPVYNVEKYLEQCLESVIGQTYKNIEIICVNDESPDNSISILNRYAEKDNRIVVVNQQNTGLSGARNTGIRISTGEYIVFLDSDDWMEKETISYAMSELEKDKVDTVMWGYIREFGDVGTEKVIFDNDVYFDKYDTSHCVHRRIVGLCGQELSRPENADSLATAWGKLYKASIIKENSIFFTDTKIIGTEDVLFNLYYFKYVESCKFINKPFNHYRKDNIDSLTRTYKPNLFKQWTKLYSLINDYIETNIEDGKDEFYSALKNRICLSMIGIGLNELSSDKSSSEIKAKIKTVLNSDLYVNAFSSLNLNYFPVYWRVFFKSCKNRNYNTVCLLLNAIQRLIYKH